MARDTNCDQCVCTAMLVSLGCLFILMFVLYSIRLLRDLTADYWQDTSAILIIFIDSFIDTLYHIKLWCIRAYVWLRISYVDLDYSNSQTVGWHLRVFINNCIMYSEQQSTTLHWWPSPLQSTIIYGVCTVGSFSWIYVV